MKRYCAPACIELQCFPGGPVLTGSNEGFPVDPTPFGGRDYFPDFDDEDDEL